MSEQGKAIDEFKVGDVVCLKSGGPKMTVTAANDEILNVPCVWFGYANEIQEASFLRATIGLIKETP